MILTDSFNAINSVVENFVSLTLFFLGRLEVVNTSAIHAMLLFDMAFFMGALPLFKQRAGQRTFENIVKYIHKY